LTKYYNFDLSYPEVKMLYEVADMYENDDLITLLKESNLLQRQRYITKLENQPLSHFDYALEHELEKAINKKLK
jgi:hypothetical protein